MQRQTRFYWSSTSVISLALLFSGAVNGAELRPVTAHAFEEYLAEANARMVERTHGTFLWIDDSKERLRRVRAGEVVVAPMQPKMPIPVSHGLVHHWIGASFVPGAHMDEVIARLRDYNRYDQFYASAVKNVQVIERASNPDRAHDRFTVTLGNESFFSKRALESEYTSRYTPLDAHRSYSICQSVRIQEWSEYGTARQHKLPAGEGSGYIWKIGTISRFEERDGGVYVEIEAIALSRDVPLELRFLVDPIIRRTSASSLAISLQETRKAVETRVESAALNNKVGGL
jgi:hypothetical protein